MQPFDYIIPKDHAEASALLASGNGATRPLQGGTDFLIRARGGFIKPQRVVDLKRLPGMQQIRQSADGWLIIGAACTMNQVANHPLVRPGYDLLVQGCNSVASYQLRNRATIGGNICNASPAADTAPALYCLDAVAEVYGPAGVRRIPITEFFVGPGRTALQPGEFLTAIHLPPALPAARGVFNKLGRTRLGDISIVSVAVWMAFAQADPAAVPNPQYAARSTHYALRDVRIALGAVGPTPLRATEAEAALLAGETDARNRVGLNGFDPDAATVAGVPAINNGFVATPTTQPPDWVLGINWQNSARELANVDLGNLAGTRPRYLIEYRGQAVCKSLNPNEAAADCSTPEGKLSPTCNCYLFRITARSNPGQGRAEVILQSLFTTF